MRRHSLRSPGRLALFAVALLPLARAESPASVCEPAPEVESALRDLWAPPKPNGAAITPSGTVTLVSSGNYVEERLSKLTALLERFPDDFFVHRERAWLLRTLPPQKRKASSAEYRAMAEQHPEHPGYPYLAAQLLVGLDTPAAIAALEQALQRNPDFPWPHLGLVEIYGFPNFQDNPKAIKHIEAFIDACPEVVEGYGELRRFETSTELASNAAKKLRKLLESSDDPRAVLNYTSLWTLEFKAPRAEHDRLRERVRDDVAKIEKLNRKDDFMWHMTLREGYTIIGDKKGSEQVEQQMSAHFAALLSKLDSRYGNLDSMQAESPWSVSRRWTPKPVKQAFWGSRSLTEGGLRRAA